MGRKGSILVPFLREALKCGKYGSVLVYDDEEKEIFKLTLSRMSNSLNSDSVRMLEDWNRIKERKFIVCGQNNYSVSKQRLLMALKRSRYLKCVSSDKNGVKYKFLSHDELKDKTDSKIKLFSGQQSNYCSSLSPAKVIPSRAEFSNYQSECSSGTRNRILQVMNGKDHCGSREMPCHAQCLKPMQTDIDIQFTDEQLNLIASIVGEPFEVGYPGVIANTSLLKRILSCHVSKPGEDNLLLFWYQI